MKKVLMFVLSIIIPIFSVKSQNNDYKNYRNDGLKIENRYDERLYSQNKKIKRKFSKKEETRKYYLLHPFFQPTESNTGLVLDFSYNNFSYDALFKAITPISDNSAKWNSKGFNSSANLSYGLSDNLSFVGMLNYNNTEHSFDWKTDPDDRYSVSEIDIFGLGLQYRFLDSKENIGTLSLSYQNYKDLMQGSLVDFKIGHKVNKITFYVGGRFGFYFNQGIVLGNMIKDTNVLVAYIISDQYNFGEGSFGLFSVFGEYLTLNIEGVFGNYKWHEEGFAKLSLGIQPNRSFSVNAYGKLSIFNSANNKDLRLFTENAINKEWFENGTVQVSNFSNIQLGLQAIFYF